MNAQDYIASGLLEAYVFGGASEAEAAEVALAISRYPEVAEEVAAMEETMFQIGKAGALQPPAQLQEAIWNRIAADREAPEPVAARQPAPKVIPLDAPQRNRLSWLRAAVWVGLLASLAGNYIQYTRRHRIEQGYTALQQQVDRLSSSQARTEAALARYQKEADMMADPDMKPVVMQTMQKDHPMAATIYWSKSRGEAYVSVQKLPMPPKGRQYQLWAIADGKPVDLGVLRNDMIGTAGMEKVAKAVAGGQAFAISLEKEGGSPTPTMDQIYVMGKVI